MKELEADASEVERWVPERVCEGNDFGGHSEGALGPIKAFNRKMPDGKTIRLAHTTYSPRSDGTSVPGVICWGCRGKSRGWWLRRLLSLLSPHTLPRLRTNQKWVGREEKVSGLRLTA